MNLNEKKIVIAERDNIAALIENKKVSEFFIHRGDVLLGDVYLGQVENVLPSIDAAFVNVGSDKMGFLHAEDAVKRGALQDKLFPKQNLILQVVKEPVGHKGPRLTSEISLPGRFLVLMPTEPGVSVSKKITGIKERARLKSIVNLLKPVGVGVIIRTEAEGQSEADIQEDLEILLEKWNNIITASETLEAPSLLYRDQDLLYRVIREACTEDVQEIIVDTAFALNRVQTLLQNWHLGKNIKATLYKGSEPLLVAMGIHKEIKAALQMKVNLPSGGYLFIQTTEALTVVDVNSGKFTNSATQDETILKTNLEAVQEIARQLRLRNIGGMIIIDFIDMNSRVDKLAVMEAFELALEPDKAKPQIGQLSDLGLVELTRHRQGQALAEIFAKRCPHCQGNGFIMEDLKFASATSEGEYRAKAAKMKLPVSNFKKNNNNKFNNKNQKQQQVEEETIEITEQTPVVEIPEPVVEIENPSVVAVEETEKKEVEKQEKETSSKKKRGAKRYDRRKAKEASEAEVTTAETILPPDAEIAPTIAENAAKPSKDNAKEENKEEVIKTETEIASSETQEVEEKSTKRRRPNRGTQKRGRAKSSKKAETSEE